MNHVGTYSIETYFNSLCYRTRVFCNSMMFLKSNERLAVEHIERLKKRNYRTYTQRLEDAQGLEDEVNSWKSFYKRRRNDFLEYFLISACAMGIVSIFTYFVYEINSFSQSDSIRSEIYNQAQVIADVNKDGITSLDETVKMLEAMGITINLTRETKTPNCSQLEKYISEHRVNANEQQH